MRRTTLLAIALLLGLTGPLTAQTPAPARGQAPPPAGPPHAWLFGAWVGGRTSAFRYGFVFQLYPVRNALKDYYLACWRAAPWPLK